MKQRTVTIESIKQAIGPPAPGSLPTGGPAIPRDMPTMGRWLPTSAAGVGLAALENKYIVPDLDPGLKKVNLGIGGITGYLWSSPDPKVRMAALASLPFKEMGLFGISAADKLRKQQQSLVDANLAVASINKATAETQHSNVGSQGRRALMYLLPAILAGGGIGYLAYDRWKKNKAKIPRWQTTGERGVRRTSQKVRIDVPTSALPQEFFTSLARSDESPKAYTRLMEMAQEEPKEAKELLRKWAAAEEQRFSLPRFLGETAADLTGIPGTLRAVKDLGRGASEYVADEKYRQPGRQFQEAGRYGLGALGNLMLTLASARVGAGLAGKMMPNLLKAQMGLVPGIKPGMFRTLAKPFWKWGPGYEATIAARNLKHAYDPMRFAWSGGTSRNPLYRSLLSERPIKPGTVPSVTGQLYDTARYGANRLFNLGYRGEQMFHRYPVMGPTLLGLPLAGLGSQRDERLLNEARKQYQSVPDWERNRGPGNIPVSSAFAGLMSAMGQDRSKGIKAQLQGSPWDPFAYAR